MLESSTCTQIEPDSSPEVNHDDLEKDALGEKIPTVPHIKKRRLSQSGPSSECSDLGDPSDESDNEV